METINYFQSKLTFKNYSSINLSRSENRLAHALVKEGRELVKTADSEMKNGKTALNLAIDGQHKILNRDMAKIALWHYQQAAKNYRRAVDEFGQAGRIWQQSKRRRVTELEARRMLALALKAESTVEFLNEYLQNK